VMNTVARVQLEERLTDVNTVNVQLEEHVTNLTFMEPRIARCVFYVTNEMQLIQWSSLLSALYMFRAVFSPIIRSL